MTLSSASVTGQSIAIDRSKIAAVGTILVRSAGATRFPSVGIAGGSGAQRSDPSGASARTSKSTNVSLGVSYEVDLWGRLAAGVQGAGLLQRVLELAPRLEQRAIVRIQVQRLGRPTLHQVLEVFDDGLGSLAIVATASPFIGLFGTVWGIKHSFEQIAISQNTNLAVVAPGIAEALLATAVGLIAAIPAVVFYNKLNADSERIIGGYEAFADEFATILSRQLDA